MNNSLSPRDYEQLSAYLDGEISSKERSQLEARLREDRDLSQALLELRQTRTVLRSLPRLRAPRNYTLSPSMVGHRAPRRFTFPRLDLTLQWGAMVATLLLALVVLGDFVGRGAQMQNLAASQSEVALAPEMDSMATAGEEAYPTPLPAGRSMLPETTPTEEGMTLLAEPPTDTMATEMMPVEPSGNLTVTMLITGTALQDGLPPEVGSVPDGMGGGDSEFSSGTGVNWLLGLEITLAVGAVSMALLAWWLRRSRS